MMKVTIVPNGDFKTIKKGTKVRFELEPNDIDPNCITAYADGKAIGYVASSGATNAPDCLLNIDLMKKVSFPCEGEFKEKFTISKRSVKTLLIVEIGEGKIESKSDTKIFSMKIKGATSKFPNKMEVIKEFTAGAKVFVTAKLEDDTINIYHDNIPAGTLDLKISPTVSSLEDIEVLKEILAKEELEARVTSTEKASYIVEVSVSTEVLQKAKEENDKKAISGTRQELVNKGFNEETLLDIEAYLLKNKFSVDEIQDIFSTYKVYDKSVAWRIPLKPKAIFKDTFEALKTGFASIENGFHILCSGEKGTGKNVFVENMSYLLQRPLYSISINRETDKLDLLGSKTIESTSENGVAENKVVFSPEVLLEAMQVGGLLNIDEINFADAGITGLLHSIMDDRRSIEVPGYKYVKADENFVVMATMNVGYNGTNDLNEALQDRFIDLLFPNNESIFDVLEEKCPSMKKSDLQTADKLYKKMVDLVRDRDSSLDDNCITVRGFIQACIMSNKLGLKKALEICVANKVKDEEYRQNIKNLIDMYIK